MSPDPFRRSLDLTIRRHRLLADGAPDDAPEIEAIEAELEGLWPSLDAGSRRLLGICGSAVRRGLS